MKRLNIDKKVLIIFSACHIIYSSTFAEESNKVIDATNIPFEELLQTDYIPASKIAEQINSSSSAVSTVTAREIKLYGYKTLSEILNSMRGLQTFQDYGYTYLGGRGYSQPGEYAGKIIVLLDGCQINDSMYGQAFFDQDALLDVSLIEKVEYVPGGSSSGYTSNALLGIINITTKNGSSINGTEVSYGYGSHKTQNRRVTFGKKFENSADVLFSLSDYNTAGRNFNYILNDQNISSTNNDAKNYRMFLKTAYKNLTLESALSSQKKNMPSYPVNSLTSEMPMEQQDESKFIRLKYDADITADTKLSTSFWYGNYYYDFANNIMDPLNYYINGTKAKWYGYDMKIIGTWFDKHLISIGTEYKSDYFLGEYSTTSNSSSSYKYDPKKLYTGYFYDNYELFPLLTLSYGARVEQTDKNNNKEISPQIAILWQVHKNTLLKLSTSKTSRQPTLYENRREKLENARKTEFVIEQSFDNNIKFLTSLYNYHISDRATWYDNGDIKANGFENEIEKYFDNDVELKASYAYQKAYQIEDRNIPLVNTPTHIAKLHMGIPLIGKDLQMGTEVLYLGSRPDFNQDKVKSHTVANLNFLSQDWIQNTDISFKINNLFDKRYNDIMYYYIVEEKYYPQDGRTFYLEMEYKF